MTSLISTSGIWNRRVKSGNQGVEYESVGVQNVRQWNPEVEIEIQRSESGIQGVELRHNIIWGDTTNQSVSSSMAVKRNPSSAERMCLRYIHAAPNNNRPEMKIAITTMAIIFCWSSLLPSTINNYQPSVISHKALVWISIVLRVL